MDSTQRDSVKVQPPWRAGGVRKRGDRSEWPLVADDSGHNAFVCGFWLLSVCV